MFYTTSVKRLNYCVSEGFKTRLGVGVHEPVIYSYCTRTMHRVTVCKIADDVSANMIELQRSLVLSSKVHVYTLKQKPEANGERKGRSIDRE